MSTGELQEEGADRPAVELSLFEGDPLDRVLRWLLVEGSGAPHSARRVVFAVLSTWVALFLLAAWRGQLLGATKPESFLLDAGAHAQFLFAVPILLGVRPYVDRLFRRASKQFAEAGLLAGESLAELSRAARRRGRAARHPAADLIALVLAYAATWTWLLGEIANLSTWRQIGLPGSAVLSPGGWWTGLFAVPFLIYVLFAWVWKMVLWFAFLWSASRSELAIRPSHPDRAGGLGFLGRTQARLGALIFAVGVQVVATVLGKISNEGEVPSGFALWGPLGGFVVLAPAIFIAPLFVFSRALADARLRALLRCSALMSALAGAFEDRWVEGPQTSAAAKDLLASGSEVEGLASLEQLYTRIDGMHVLPFDLGSLGRLSLSVLAPLLPVLPQIVPLPGFIARLFSFYQ